MKNKLEELGTISEADFAARMRGFKISSVIGISLSCIFITLGCACILYVFMIARGIDPLGVIDGSSSSPLVNLVMLHSLILLLLFLGAIYYIHGRSTFGRIAEYHFMRQILKDLHNKGVERTR